MKIATLLSAIAAFAAAAAATAELEIDVTHKVECERKTQKGDKVSMHYRGTLAADGSKFDASYDRGTPLDFVVGAGQGLLDMCIGEKRYRRHSPPPRRFPPNTANTLPSRTLTIPPEYGYGDRGIGPIPGGATLIFETELVGIAGVKPPAKAEEAAPEGAAKTAKVNLLEALRRVVCGRSLLT
ncbi:hypothetical protein LLEC1_02069 [Akanthomyces lecanii]|uniref:peptidylprolyl isomerase n=1 Tax=Cordyceps confragosa TaxID=2714763 RepID=A0A179IGG6_CORDF|nr:hypothetical protein LLEC1_02069 [Akanthomyces lecanii]